MKTNDIVSLYVSFVETGSGKKRPVLVRTINDKYIQAFKITTKYHNKSLHIQRQYFHIHDWRQAGLYKESWVDIGQILNFPKIGLTFKTIGRLSNQDILNLDAFIKNFKLSSHKDEL